MSVRRPHHLATTFAARRLPAELHRAFEPSRLRQVAVGVAAVALSCSAGPEASPDPFEPPATGLGGSLGAAAAGGSSPSATAGSGGAAAGAGPVSSGGSEGVPPVGGLGGAAGSDIGSGGVAAGGAGGAASGGAGGSAAGAGTGGTGSPGVTCGEGDILCDDFESATLGIFPDSPGWDPNACTSHVVDGSVFRGGSRSLRGGAEQYPACMAHANIAGENEVYARSWIRLGAPSSESGHEIGVLELGPTLADNPEVRVGVRNNDSVCASAPGVEVTADGVTGGEKTSCSGLALEAERWYCLEVHFARAPGSITYGVQIDGNTVVPETTYTGAVAAWTDGPLFLKLGRSSYGGNNVFPVWHDDVVVSSAPVGCSD
jgi:hypothetical protein